MCDIWHVKCKRIGRIDTLNRPYHLESIYLDDTSSFHNIALCTSDSLSEADGSGRSKTEWTCLGAIIHVAFCRSCDRESCRIEVRKGRFEMPTDQDIQAGFKSQHSQCNLAQQRPPIVHGRNSIFGPALGAALRHIQNSTPSRPCTCPYPGFQCSPTERLLDANFSSSVPSVEPGFRPQPALPRRL